MARSFNQVTIMGNLTRDPELRQTPGGNSVCSFSLALNRSYKGSDGNWVEAVDYIDVVAWGPLGERVAQYMAKGRAVLVNGRLQSRSWEQDGQKRSKVEVNAQDVIFVGGPNDGGSGGSGDGGGSYAGASNDQSAGAKPAPSKKPSKDDVQIDDLSDEPINLDDIPF